jgi:hypothetical protein
MAHRSIIISAGILSINVKKIASASQHAKTKFQMD